MRIFKILWTQHYKLGLFLIELNLHKKKMWERKIKKKDFISGLKFRILKFNRFMSTSGQNSSG